MPDRQIAIKVSLEGLQDASSAAKGFTTDVQGIGAAAAETTAQAEPLAPAIDKTAVALKSAGVASTELTGSLREKLGPAAQAAYDAFEKLSTSKGPRGMTISIVEAQNATDRFRAAVESARASGEKMPPAVTAAVKTMQGDIDAATLKLGKFRETMGDVRTRATQMGEGWTQAAASGGSLNAMLNNLESTSTGATKSFSQFGLKVIGVFEAFKLGLGIGKEFNTWIDDVRRASGDSTSALAGLAKVIGDTGVAGAGFKKWADEAAKATRYFGDEMEPVTFKVNALMKAHQAAGKQLASDVAVLKTVGVAWEDVGTEAQTTAQRIKYVDDALAQSNVQGKSQLETIRLNAKALQELKQRLEDEGISLDSLSPRLRTAILLSEGLVEAHTKHAAAVKLIREANEQVVPGMSKLLNALQQEDQAAQKSKTSITDTANAHQKAVIALADYAKQNGLSAEQVAKMIVAQGKMLDVTKAATEEGILRMTIALEKEGVDLEDVAQKSETTAQAITRVAEAAKKANEVWGAEQAAIHERNADAMKKEAAAAASLADAFGRVAGGLTAVSAQADNAAAGLEGVNWAMRKATPATFELTDAQKALVESLAKISDAGGASSLWVGHLISQLETGALTFEEFQKQVNATLRGLTVFGSVMGNTAEELNAINTLLSKFKNDATTGWPTGPGGHP